MKQSLKPTEIRRHVLELCATGAINAEPYQFRVRKALGELTNAGLAAKQDKKWDITVDGKLVLLRWTR